MAYCNYCGVNIETGTKFCPSCGKPATDQEAPGASGGQTAPDQGHIVDAKDAEDNKAMGILAYILVLIPLFAAPKDSKFARFHTNQGLILFILGLAYGLIFWLINALLYIISWQLALAVTWIFGLAAWIFPVFCIIGIIRVCKGEMKPLPLIGKFQILK